MNSIPILGQSAPQPDRFDREYGGVHDRSAVAQGDIHDSEILELEKIFADMRYRYAAKAFDLAEFDREARERCHRLGFAIDIIWKDEVEPVRHSRTGRKVPVIEIVGRTEKAVFDHDRKVHEVTRNILGLPGQEGIIKSDGAVAERPHTH